MKINTLALILLCLSGLSSCQQETSSDEPIAAANGPATLYLIRHAEKDTTITENPPLTEQGQERAERFAAFLSEAKIDAIYSSKYLRTKQTVAPLAAMLKLVIHEYDAKAPVDTFIHQILVTHPSQRVVVVGHSNTIPKMLNALLQQQQFEDLADDAYDYIFQVVIDKQGNTEVFSYKMTMP